MIPIVTGSVFECILLSTDDENNNNKKKKKNKGKWEISFEKSGIYENRRNKSLSHYVLV